MTKDKLQHIVPGEHIYEFRILWLHGGPCNYQEFQISGKNFWDASEKMKLFIDTMFAHRPYHVQRVYCVPGGKTK